MQDHRPHVVGEYYSGPDEKQPFLRDLFDRTAQYYERIGLWGWLGTGGAYRQSALRRAGYRAEMTAIDVASGTGAVARALVRIANSPEQVVCVEPSAAMIAESRKRLDCVHHQATAEALPAEDASFDFLTMGFALRHVDDLTATFDEFRRVLKPGGKALILELTPPCGRIGRALFRLHFKHVLPRLSYLITLDRSAFRLMRYYWESMDQMTDPDEIVRMLQDAGFSEVRRRVSAGFCSEFEAVR